MGARPLVSKEYAPQCRRQLGESARSRSVNNPTSGVRSFAAPVFDYTGNIVPGITLMGRFLLVRHELRWRTDQGGKRMRSGGVASPWTSTLRPS